MPLSIDPPVLNSATPWATNKEDLQALYECPQTGAVTTRTALLQGFRHDPAVHQHCFASTSNSELTITGREASGEGNSSRRAMSLMSLNTYGYSPFSIQEYLSIVSDILRTSQPINGPTVKPFIFSVTGKPEEIIEHRDLIVQAQSQLRRELRVKVRFMMEINLSCPNIAGKPPPAYSHSELLPYLNAVNSTDAASLDGAESDCIHVGIKAPPYTYQTQFDELISALRVSNSSDLHTMRKKSCPIDFITAINTLGSCLLLSLSDLPKHSSAGRAPYQPVLSSANGTGTGGLAGTPLHPLALGNVATLRRMLDKHESLKTIEIIGVGGVSDAAGMTRMRSAGAVAVGVGTGLGVEGLEVFSRIWRS